MNERDKELAVQSELMRKYNYAYSKELQEFADLIRADAMEAATRAANESWSLACKKMVEFEREACAKTVETIETYEKIEKACFKFAAKTIRARGNT
jgi:hypothetical protein